MLLLSRHNQLTSLPCQPTTTDFLLNAADMELHGAVDGLDDTLTLLDVGSVDGGAMLGASVDDLDLSFLSELLHQGEELVPSRRRRSRRRRRRSSWWCRLPAEGATPRRAATMTMT